MSLVGSALSSFALGVWLYQATGSAVKLGLVFACALIPTVLASPIAGPLVDRWGRRRALLVSNCGAMAVALVLAVLLATHSFAAWVVYPATIIAALFRSLQVPAFGSAVPLLVPKRHIGRANGMMQLATAASQVLSPVIAGYLLLAIKLKGIILIDCVSFGVAVLTLLVIRIPNPPPPQDEVPGAEPGTLLGSFARGWDYVAARRGLVSLMILFGALCFYCGFVDVLYVPIVLAFSSTGALGTVLTAGGAGMVAGSLAMSVWGGPSRRTTGVLGFAVLLGASIILGAARPSIPLIAVASFVFLGSTSLLEGCYQSIWQTKIEPSMQGRVLALQNMVTLAPQVASYLLVGVLADSIFQPLVGAHRVRSHLVASLVGTGAGRGFALMLLIIGVLVLATAAWAYLNPRIRHLEDELPDAVGVPAAEPTPDRV
jgi:predicted MFS family arabinose efflux permease